MMREGRNTRTMVLFCSLVFLLIPLLSYAQEYPTKSITCVNTTSAGTGTDVVPRALLEEAKKFVGQSFVTVNKAGGGGTVGMTALSKEKPDGYTIGTGTPLPLIVTPQLRKVGYSLEDFAPISLFANTISGLAVRTDSPWKTLSDLVDYAKKNPKKIRIAISSGVGNFKEIAMRIVAKRNGVEFIYVPNPQGDAGGLTDILGGHIEALSAGPVWVPHIQSGKLRLLAVYNKERAKSFPEVRTLKELGYDCAFEIPMVMLAPKGTPPFMIKKLDDTFRRAIDEPGYTQTLKNLNYEFAYQNADDTKKWLENNRGLWGSIIKEYNIPAE